MNAADIYGGKDPTRIPAYSVREAARYLRLPESTVRSWVAGRGYRARDGMQFSPPVIQAADPAARLLSFQNLVELHVLSAIRQQRVDLPAVRRAVQFLEREFGTKHPLADRQLFTAGKSVLVEQFGHLIDASRGGQVAVRQLVEAYLRRIDRDPSGVPIRLYPYTRSPEELERFVSIDPRVQFGRPCVNSRGVPTDVLLERWRAGDSISALADDYGLRLDEIEAALRYEYPVGQAA